MRVTQMGGGMPSPMMGNLFHDDEEEDEGNEGIPPEILQMMKMTEMMHGSMGFGGMGPGIHMKIRKIGGPSHVDGASSGDPNEPNLPAERQEESVDSIMDRMNKLSDEVSALHENRKKYDTINSKSSRFIQVLAIGGTMILLMLVSFIMTCRNKSDKQDDEDSSMSEAAQFKSKKRVD